MFDSTSRYKNLEIAQTSITAKDGTTRTVKYVRRRFLPKSAGVIVVQEHIVNDGDRLDNITAIHIGDPTQFWRVADLNTAMNPFDLTTKIGHPLRISGLNDEDA